MNLPNRIRELRKARGLTLAQLASALNPPADIAGLQKIEIGKTKLNVHWMGRIADALGVEPGALIGEGQPTDLAWVPLIGTVAAGRWQEAVTHAGEERVPMVNPPKDAFALRAEGDSMNMIVADGGFVVVDPHARELVPGRIYVAQSADGVTLKRFQLDPPRFEPCSTNPAHKPIVLGYEPFTVIGRVVWTAAPV